MGTGPATTVAPLSDRAGCNRCGRFPAIRHHGAIAAFSEEVGPSAPAIGGTLITGAGMCAAVNHDDGRAAGRGHRSKSLEIDRHRRSDQAGLMDHDMATTARPSQGRCAQTR